MITKQILRRPWSPYFAGALIGVLSWVTFALMGKALGVSTTFVRIGGKALEAVAPAHVASNSYYSKYLSEGPPFEWQAALVVALVAGALVAARFSGEPSPDPVPEIWRSAHGGSRVKRNLAAFAGGILLLFGARMAGGCTSGHGISGGLQLAVSGWVFIAAVFAGGIPVALLLYRNKTTKEK